MRVTWRYDSEINASSIFKAAHPAAWSRLEIPIPAIDAMAPQQWDHGTFLTCRCGQAARHSVLLTLLAWPIPLITLIDRKLRQPGFPADRPELVGRLEDIDVV